MPKVTHSLCVGLRYASCFIPTFWPLDLLSPRILKNFCTPDVRREVLRQYVPYCGLLSNDIPCLVTNHQITIWCNSRNTGAWTDYRTSILYVTSMVFLCRIHKTCSLWRDCLCHDVRTLACSFCESNERSSGSRSRKQRLTAVGTRCADHVTPLYPQKVGTNFADRRRPLCRYSSRAD